MKQNAFFILESINDRQFSNSGTDDHTRTSAVSLRRTPSSGTEVAPYSKRSRDPELLHPNLLPEGDLFQHCGAGDLPSSGDPDSTPAVLAQEKISRGSSESGHSPQFPTSSETSGEFCPSTRTSLVRLSPPESCSARSESAFRDLWHGLELP